MRHHLREIFVILTVAALCSPVRSQDIDAPTKLRLAQSFQQAGDWERAVALYESLYHSDPTNYLYFDGLRNGYMQLRSYDKAINLVEQQLTLHRNDVVLLASLGGVYYESGSEQKADSVWNRVIGIDPKNIGLYRVVASQMLEHRLFQQAVNIYLAGRAATGQRDAFDDELASLYMLLQQYTAASTEFIKLLHSSPQQLSFVESRIASFTIREAGLRAATDVTREEVNKGPDNITVRELYAWLAMEGKDYRTAFEEYRVIDRLGNADGAELLDFARRASQEKSYGVASEAFQNIVVLSRSPAIVSQARFGYARSMEDLSAQADSVSVPASGHAQLQGGSEPTRISESEESLQNVVHLYEAVIKDYPSTELAAQSFYRIGIIRMDRLFDFNGALEAFGQVKSMTRSVDLASESSLKTAEVYIAQNNLTSARREYESLLMVTVPAYRQSAQFGIAELDYFEGRFDSSLTELKPLVATLNSDLSNDALMLQYFILENKAMNEVALTEYAKADLLKRQKKYSEALARFTEVVHLYPATLLVDDATMKMGELHLLLNQPNEALTAFQHVVFDMPESILRDRAELRIAETYQSVLKDKEKAIGAYEFILAKFPNSLYVEQARKRIRQLRGDAS